MLSFFISYLREYVYEDIKVCRDIKCSKCNKTEKYGIKSSYCLSKHTYCSICRIDKITCRQCKYYFNIE